MITRERYEEIARKVAAVYAENAVTYAEVDLIHQRAKEIMVVSVPEPSRQ